MIRLQRYLVRQFQVCSVLTWLIPVTFRHLCWLLLCVPVAMAHHAPGGMPNSNRQRAVTEYVHFQWRKLNQEFQRCCASSEPFDVNVWVEQNVNRARASWSVTAEQNRVLRGAAGFDLRVQCPTSRRRYIPGARLLQTLPKRARHTPHRTNECQRNPCSRSRGIFGCDGSEPVGRARLCTPSGSNHRR